MNQRIFILGGFLAFAAACTIVNGLEVARDDPADAGMDVVDGGNPIPPDTGPVDRCNHAYPVGPPSTPGGGVQFFVSALSDLDIGTRDSGSYELIGFDLDQTCSCQTAEPTCISPASITGVEGGCDDDGGIDNAATQLFQQAFNLTAGKLELQDDFSSALRAGAPGVLVYVSSYNGLADDPDVGVAVLISPGPESGDRPTFEPGEVWLAGSGDTRELPGGTRGPLKYLSTITGGAYVTSGHLVARGDITLPLLAGLNVRFLNGILTADIKKDLDGGAPYVTNGTITGRAPLADVLRAIGGVEKPRGSGVHLCDGDDPKNTELYATFKQAVCGSPDILQGAGNKNSACDALSFAIHFTAVPAVLSNTTSDLVAVTYCADADVDCGAN